MKASTRTVRRLLPVAFASLAGALVTVGSITWASAPGAPPASRSVQISPEDLTTPERVAVLYKRLRGAARSVCGYADSRFREEQAAWDNCVETTLGRAVAKVGSERLTDYYLARARRGRAVPSTEASKVANLGR